MAVDELMLYFHLETTPTNTSELGSVAESSTPPRPAADSSLPSWGLFSLGCLT